MSIYTPLPSLPPQTPSDTLDNEFQFSLPAGDYIVSANVGSDSTTLLFPDLLISGNSVIVWVSGGTPNTTATITVNITTAQGRTYNRSATMQILPLV
jgi:hypothetical protein